MITIPVVRKGDGKDTLKREVRGGKRGNKRDSHETLEEVDLSGSGETGASRET